MNSAWEYDRRIISGFNDKVGIIHVLGPAADFSLIKENFLLRLKSSVFGDFSMIKSLGIVGYLNDGHTNDDLEAKGAYVTAENGYYYAYGMTTINSVDIEYRNFQIGSELTLNLFWSINGDGRTNREPETGNNFQMEDLRLALRGWTAYNTDRDVSIRFSAEYRYLEGSAQDYNGNLDESRYMIQSVYRVR
jgi:hypothetical protein